MPDINGIPYVESTDLVSAYPAVSLALAQELDDQLAAKVDYALTANAQSGTGVSAYTFALADASRLTTATGTSAKTFTIPPQTSVTWVANSIIRVANYGTGNLTIAGGSGVTVTNATKTLAQYESAALVRTGSNAWTLIPFSGGAGNADFSNAATGTYTDGGVSYKYLTFTASGTLTVTTAGYADVLVIGGGGGGSWEGGGGAGGYLESSVYFPAATYTVTVGGGGTGSGSAGGQGNDSALGFLAALGGGYGRYQAVGASGGSGGGSGYLTNPTAGGLGFAQQGNNGGAHVGTVNSGGGGGGAGGAGQASNGATPGNGGAGKSSSITNTPTGRAGGGGGSSGTLGGSATDGGGAGQASTGTAGSANTGGGGGGGFLSSGAAGGSGVVIVRVRT